MHRASCNTFNFSCRAKQDTYNVSCSLGMSEIFTESVYVAFKENTRIRYGISRIQPLNYKEEAVAMRDLLFSPWAR